MPAKTLITSLVTLLMLQSMEAVADNATIAVNNMSGETLSGILAIPAGAADSMPVEWLNGQLAPGESTDATFTDQGDQSAGTCLYDLTLVFSSGRQDTKSNIDICQSDGITVE